MNRRIHRWLDDHEMLKVILLLTVVPLLMAGVYSSILVLQISCLTAILVIGVSRWMAVR